MILEASVWLFLDDEASLSSAVAAPSLSVGVRLFKLLEAEPLSVFNVLLLTSSTATAFPLMESCWTLIVPSD